jgi:hypothetical protein
MIELIRWVALWTVIAIVSLVLFLIAGVKK